MFPSTCELFQNSRYPLTQSSEIVHLRCAVNTPSRNPRQPIIMSTDKRTLPGLLNRHSTHSQTIETHRSSNVKTIFSSKSYPCNRFSKVSSLLPCGIRQRDPWPSAWRPRDPGFLRTGTAIHALQKVRTAHRSAGLLKFNVVMKRDMLFAGLD